MSGTLKLKAASPLTLSITECAPCLNNAYSLTASGRLMCKNYVQHVTTTFLKIHGFPKVCVKVSGMVTDTLDLYL